MPWQNLLALSSAPRVDMQDQAFGSRAICAKTPKMKTENMAMRYNFAEACYKYCIMADDWENMDFDDVTFEDDGAAPAAASTDLSSVRPAIENFSSDGGVEPLRFENITDKDLRTEVTKIKCSFVHLSSYYRVMLLRVYYNMQIRIVASEFGFEHKTTTNSDGRC